VDIAIPAFLAGMREALTYWLAFAALTLAALGLLATITWLTRADRPRAVKPPRQRLPERTAETKVAEAEARERSRTDLLRYAEEVAVAAQRAAVTAERRRSEWLAAQRFTETAWRAYDRADKAALRTLRASAYPTPRPDLEPADVASRDRLLRRAATEAFHRGDLTAGQLSDVLFHRSGWDPRRHLCEHERKLRLIGRDRWLSAYRTAADVERTAWHRADVAAAAKRALDDEAFAAKMRIVATRAPQPMLAAR
jgi:hypothetical protein